MSTITAQTLAAEYAALSAADVDQRWGAWSAVYRAFRDRPSTVTLKDIVAASKGSDYPLSQSTVQDMILAAAFTDNPHADGILASRYADKRPVRVHSLVRAVVNQGKGGTATVRAMADGLAESLAKIETAKGASKGQIHEKSARAVGKAIDELTRAGKSANAGKRAARPEGNSKGSASDAGEKATPEGKNMTPAQRFATFAPQLKLTGDAAACGKWTQADIDAARAMVEQLTAQITLAQNNRTRRSA